MSTGWMEWDPTSKNEEHLFLPVGNAPVEAPFPHPKHFSFLAHKYWPGHEDFIILSLHVKHPNISWLINWANEIFNICRCQNFQPARTELFCLGEESKEVTNRSNRACSTRWADLDVLAEEERLAIWKSNVFRQTLGTNLMQHRRRINFFEYLFTQLHCQASVNFVHLLVQLGVVPEKSSLVILNICKLLPPTILRRELTWFLTSKSRSGTLGGENL